jgi:thiamine-phosphate pyrophosphorylase
MIVQRRRNLRLVGITDPQVLAWPKLEEAARAAMGAGLPALILRERQMTDEKLEPLGRRLREEARRRGALLIVNRRVELARRLEADGVQVGKVGPSIAEARRAMGEEALVGYSAHEHKEALQAFDQGADYVLYSPVFPTLSKPEVLDTLGLESLEMLCRKAAGPIVALGGISAHNMGLTLAAGAAGVAMIRGIFAAADPAQAVKELLEEIMAIQDGKTEDAE